MSDPNEADFGFTTIPAAEKARAVGRVFSSVAQSYDLMNDLMSGGVHRLWKDAAIDWLAPRPGRAYLDVAGGTGDIAQRIAERIGPEGTITICDINPDMLRAGLARTTREGGTRAPAGRFGWVCGDAERLPLPDGCMDAYTIAFGIRNVTRIEEALREAHRVLRPGGRFLCLEFSQVAVPGLDALYDTWSFRVIPALGARLANDRAAYQYLVESIRRFPSQERFADMIATAGFARVKVRNLTGGIAALHSGWKL